MEEGIGPFSSIVAKTLIIATALGDRWVEVGNYAGSPECANLLAVTPLQCGREMYSDASWVLLTAIRWLLPQFVDLMAGLSLTTV